MTETEAQDYIRENVHVTRQKVSLAKGFFLESYARHREPIRSEKIVTAFLRDIDAMIPESIPIHRAYDPTPDLNRAVASITFRLAAWVALWDLVHAGVFLIDWKDFKRDNLSIKTVDPDRAGNEGSIEFREFQICYPESIIRSPVELTDEEQFLSDADIYLQRLQIPWMPEAIATALREAVRCFRHELYTASLVMLLHAAEGAWIGLGLALLDAMKEPPAKDSKHRNALLGQDGIAKKLKLVLDLATDASLAAVWRASAVRPQDLRDVHLWTDTIRESRNAIHFAVKPAIPNTYEKVAALLIGAVPHLRVIYRVIASVQQNTASSTTT